MTFFKSKHKGRRLGLYLALFVLGLLAAQMIWVDACLRQCQDKPSADAVVVFSGDDGRIRAGVRLARESGAKYLLVSREQKKLVEGIVREEGGLPGVMLFIDDSFATSTDGNARYAAPLLKDLSVQDAALVTSWFHMPRSLFLLKLYLGTSSIRVYPYAYGVIPDQPWESPLLQVECFKFWGSILRVALHAVGVDDWPRVESGLKSFKKP
jgi:uncharacterized SAM-binding protein YcdF (DUF218 family)